MEVFVAETGSVNVFPCCGVIKAEFIWGYANNWAVFVVAIFNEEWDSASEKTDCAWDLRKLVEVMKNEVHQVSSRIRLGLTGEIRARTGPGNLRPHHYSLFPIPIYRLHTLLAGESTTCI
jgi:hypothetical protein